MKIIVANKKIILPEEKKIEVIKFELPKRMFIDPRTGLITTENPRIKGDGEFQRIKV